MHAIEQAFARLGARAVVHDVGWRAPAPGRPSRYRHQHWSLDREPPAVRLDVRVDARGEFFHVARRSDALLDVADVRESDRHLLIVARAPEATAAPATYLCGRDERHWFVAAVPERAGAGSVQAAKDALKPRAVWDAIAQFGVDPRDRDARRTAAFVRQGEWFFIPRPKLRVPAAQVLRDEPIRRGEGKPHQCQFLYRTAGVRVFVCAAFPNGLTQAEFDDLGRKAQRQHLWREMVRDARAYVKGGVRHPDHKTVWLPDWHEVVMNTETEAAAMQHVAFLD